MRRKTTALALAACLLALPLGARAGERELHSFDRIRLTDVYYSEGASAGDIDGDGHVDAVYGPYWFAGPKFEEKHEFYAPVPQPTDRYADHFFAWVRDFDGDGDNDVADIDALAAAIRAQSNDLRWDLDGDGRVSSADHTTWVRVIKYTTAGDATLDGKFDSTDLVQAFQAGRYETGLAAGWAEGDWTGDGLFDSGDFLGRIRAG
ncbi:MAG: hypothetical protein KC466_21380, partial [Myxococcales bacterium]|nr:hypothetical protein [Myxococcales bacterium]